jgi:Tfp pilus assembly protein PilN
VTRQPDFSSVPRASRRRLPGHLALAAGAIALVAAGLLWFQAQAERQVAERRLAEVSREVALARDRVRALQAQARAARAGSLAPAEAPPARIVSEIARVLPDDVRLERLAIDYRDGGTLELQVVARDAGAWDRLLQRLESEPRIRDAEPGPEARAAEVRSLVRARWTTEP